PDNGRSVRLRVADCQRRRARMFTWQVTRAAVALRRASGVHAALTERQGRARDAWRALTPPGGGTRMLPTAASRSTPPKGGRTSMKRALCVLAVALVGFAMAQPPVSRVGTLMSYTGALAEFGPAINNGASLAADQLNAAASAVLGGPIVEIVSEDTGTNPAQAVDRARKLVNTDGVIAIVGALASSSTVAAAESVAIPSEVIMISPASTSPLVAMLPDTNDYIYRTVSSDALQGVVGAQLARGEIIDGVS